MLDNMTAPVSGLDLLIMTGGIGERAAVVGGDTAGRLAYLGGAEERSRSAEGRPLTADELERVTRRYPTG